MVSLDNVLEISFTHLSAPSAAAVAAQHALRAPIPEVLERRDHAQHAAAEAAPPVGRRDGVQQHHDEPEKPHDDAEQDENETRDSEREAAEEAEDVQEEGREEVARGARAVATPLAAAETLRLLGVRPTQWNRKWALDDDGRDLSALWWGLRHARVRTRCPGRLVLMVHDQHVGVAWQRRARRVGA